jgi:hypothetical protein
MVKCRPNGFVQCFWVLWIPNGDVAGHAFVETARGEGAEGGAHVGFNVGAVSFDGGEVFEAGRGGESNSEDIFSRGFDPWLPGFMAVDGGCHGVE